MTRGELTRELAARLGGGSGHEARFILDEVLGSCSAGATVTAEDAATARRMAERRRSGEPLQYILGHWAFRTVDLLVDHRVLVPRPETEQVVQVALDELHLLGPASPVIVDAGTGSGAIALAMAVELATTHPGGRVWALDASADALAVAAANLDRVRAAHGGSMLPVDLVRGSWLDPLPPYLRGAVDLVVSNPPYVAASEWDELPPDVRCEPHAALVAPAASDGTPGLACVETVLTEALGWLARPGVVVVELAPHQAAAATAMAAALGYGHVRVASDLSHRPRALVGYAP